MLDEEEEEEVEGEEEEEVEEEEEEDEDEEDIFEEPEELEDFEEVLKRFPKRRVGYWQLVHRNAMLHGHFLQKPNRIIHRTCT